MISETFQDQCDADRAAAAFIESKAPSDHPYEIETFVLGKPGILDVDGRVTCLWFRSRLIAQAIVVRDPMNYSVLTCVNLYDNMEFEA